MRVNVSAIVDQPGATRRLIDAVAASEFGDDWGPVDGSLMDPVALDLHLDAVVDGILVRGDITFQVVMYCARCLRELRSEIESNVTELFTDPGRNDVEAEPGYELIDDLTAIDLSTLARDALLIDVPMRVLCTPACAGLCVECGADLNTNDCGHRNVSDVDPRWSALADLRLPPE